MRQTVPNLRTSHDLEITTVQCAAALSPQWQRFALRSGPLARLDWP